eukprot:1160997-Pelagomonas_calceolata.AAC.14
MMQTTFTQSIAYSCVQRMAGQGSVSQGNDAQLLQHVMQPCRAEAASSPKQPFLLHPLMHIHFEKEAPPQVYMPTWARIISDCQGHQTRACITPPP